MKVNTFCLSHKFEILHLAQTVTGYRLGQNKFHSPAKKLWDLLGSDLNAWERFLMYLEVPHLAVLRDLYIAFGVNLVVYSLTHPLINACTTCSAFPNYFALIFKSPCSFPLQINLPTRFTWM